MSADVLGRLGRRVRDLRVRVDLTQEQLAEKAGITWHYVSAIERGKRAATLETLAALAGALDVTLSEMLLDVDRPMARDARRLNQSLAGHPPEIQRTILKIVEEALRLVAPTERKR